MDQEDRDTLKDWVKSHRGGVMQEAAVYGRTGQETIGKVVTDEQGAPKVAGLLRNEPGALFYTVLPFFISRLNLLFCAGFQLTEVSHDS